MAIFTLNKKVTPTVLETHLIKMAKDLAQKNKSTNKIEHTLEGELTKWKLSRQKYRHSNTRLDREYAALRLFNHEDQLVFTID
jgi:hypothetical protein